MNITAVYGTAYWSSDSMIQGPIDFLLSWVAPAIAIVDAKTGGKASTGQLIGRYAGYYLAMIPLFLCFIWVASVVATAELLGR